MEHKSSKRNAGKKGYCHVCGLKAPATLWPSGKERGAHWGIQNDMPGGWAQGYLHVTLTCPACLHSPLTENTEWDAYDAEHPYTEGGTEGYDDEH